MNNKQRQYESIIYIMQTQWQDMLSGYFAKEYENKEIALSNEDINNINTLLKEVNEFEKDDTKWNKDNLKALFHKNEEKFNFILKKYNFDNYLKNINDAYKEMEK